MTGMGNTESGKDRKNRAVNRVRTERGLWEWGGGGGGEASGLPPPPPSLEIGKDGQNS
jgi:hypothetical protein